MVQPVGALSGPWTVVVPSGSQIWNHEKLEMRPGLLRTATMRPPSDCVTSIHGSCHEPVPSDTVTGSASFTFCAPSSDESHTLPPSTYATDDAALADAAQASTISETRMV